MDHFPPPPPPIRFEKDEGLNQNLFYQSPTGQCAAVVTTSERPRILLTFPAGNSGLGMWAAPELPDNAGLTMTATGPLQEDHGTVRLTIRTPHNRIAFTQVELDSLRTLRNVGDPDEGDPDELRQKYAESFQAPPGWATPLISQDGTSLTFRRAELNGRPWILRLVTTPGTRIEWTDQSIAPGGKLGSPLRLINPPGQPLEFTLEGTIPFAPLTPRSPSDLLNARALQALNAGDTRFQHAVRDLQMLSYREKYLAGTWRFETYFGRDTLLSLCMLSNTLSRPAFEDGLESVLQRLSPEGVVAHEEDVGDWAEFDDLRDVDMGAPPPAVWETPGYDYKMVDSDYLLPLAEGELATAELCRLLRGPGGTAILRNWNRVLTQAGYDLIRLNPGMVVGDWRDSLIGLGGGVYPGDVNVTLMPTALRIIHQVLASPALDRKGLLAIVQREHLLTLSFALRSSAWFDTAMRHWGQVRHQFEVRLTAAQVRQQVEAYLQSLPADQQAALRAQPVLGGPTVDAFLHGAPVPGWDGHLRFWALSLSKELHPITVLNSDTAFRLFFGQPSADELADAVLAARLPYPLGLMTDVGMVVANPAYSPSPQLWKHLDWDAYHGAVVWGWQHNLMTLGLLRQIARFRSDPRQHALVASMEALLRQLRHGEDQAGALSSSELWTWDVKDGRIVPLAFGVRASSDDESNALQLWSAAWAGVYMALHP